MAFNTLSNVLNTMNPAQETWAAQRQFQQVLEHWPEIVGSVVEQHTRPALIQRQVLQVATSNGTWAQTLMFERQRILEKLNACLTLPLKEVRFSTARWQSTDPSPQPSDADHLWHHHPSWIGPTQGETSPNITDPHEAFEAWASKMQARSRILPRCPQCQCPTPPGELERWSVCAVCVTQRWQNS